MSLLTKLFKFVMYTSAKYNIDSSHGLAHSMNILHFTKNIYDGELYIKPFLREQEHIIYISAILHDMCDKKYMKEQEGIAEIETFLQNKIHNSEIDVIKNIISTMSYSKVKVNGFPQLGIYQDAYHIVREADLLTAYDFDRCMCYRLNNSTFNVEQTFEEACALFDRRVFKHDSDGLLLTKYAKENHLVLQDNAIEQMNRWKTFIKNPTLVRRSTL